MNKDDTGLIIQRWEELKEDELNICTKLLGVSSALGTNETERLPIFVHKILTGSQFMLTVRLM